ncbi:MAG: hypothetical protein JNM27_16825 [Leptospirales bacterium]|nr:hypothetical protein [Leptospirales bacterium]
MFHLQERQFDQRCVDPAYLTALLSEHKKLPWLTRRHIHSCEACQEACAQINQTVPIQDSHFGVPYAVLESRWFGYEEGEKRPTGTFRRFREFMAKYGKYFYLLALLSGALGVIHSLFSH